MDDGIIVTAAEIGDTGTRTSTRADSAAVGRQAANGGLFVDGGQVGEGQRPQKRFVAHAQLPGIDNDRYRGSNALIAAAGVDDHRLLTAVHAGIGTGCGVCLGTDSYIIALHIQQHTADVGTVVAPQTLLGNGHVAPDLRFQNGTDILHVHRVGKVPDMLHIQQAAVGQGLLVISVYRNVHQYLAVLFHMDDIGVEHRNAHLCGMLTLPDREDDIKGDTILNVPHLDVRLVKICADGFGLLRGHIGNDLQLLFLLAGYDARSSSSLQTLHVIRVGHDDRLDVFDHAAAGFHQHFVRQLAQRIAGSSGGIGHGDRLGTAHSRDQLLPQDVNISLVSLIRLFHSKNLGFLFYSVLTGRTLRTGRW